jgi:hypothetical protein
MGRNVSSSLPYATKSIKTAQSVAGFTVVTIVTATGVSGAVKAVGSGALTAGVLSTIFSKTDGPCEMSHFTLRTLDTTARTMRLKCTIDGVVAFDYTSASTSANNAGVAIAGVVSPIVTTKLSPIRSLQSLIIECASNVSETDKFTAEYAYQEL